MRPGDQHVAEAIRLIKREPKDRPYQSGRGAPNQRQERQDQQTARPSFRSHCVVRL
jgi:hypothetical protein